MKILLISLYYEPDLASTGVFMARICEDLRRMGHEVTVVTTFPHYVGNRVADEDAGRAYARDRIAGVDVLRTYIYAGGDRGSLPKRLLNYASFNASSTAVALLAGRHDVVLATSPPLTTGITGWLLSRAWRVPLVYCLQDILPDAAVRLGMLTNPLVIRAFEELERFVYARSARIVVLSEGFRQNLLAKGVPDEKIAILPYFVDTSFIRPGPRSNAFRTRHGLGEAFLVMHAGNVGFSQDLEGMLRAAQLLREQRDIVFLIVGDGAAKARLVGLAGEMGLENVRFLPYQPAEVLPQMRAAADVQVALMKEQLASYSVPCKVYEIMASERPVVTSVEAGSDTARLVEGDGAACGVRLEPEDPQALADTVMRLYGDAKLRAAMGRNGLRRIEETYARSVVTPGYDRLLRELVRD